MVSMRVLAPASLAALALVLALVLVLVLVSVSDEAHDNSIIETH